MVIDVGQVGERRREAHRVWRPRIRSVRPWHIRDASLRADMLGRWDNGNRHQYMSAAVNANFNAIGLVDANGELVERYEYTPYGRRTVYKKSGPDDALTIAPLWGSQRVITSDDEEQPYGLNDIGHQGLPHDDESGLIYNRHRYVVPRLGRFNGPDPTGYIGGMGLYEYVASCPTQLVDPMGTMPADGYQWPVGTGGGGYTSDLAGVPPPGAPMQPPGVGTSTSTSESTGASLGTEVLREGALVPAFYVMDPQAYELWEHWLRGDGRELRLDSDGWQEYMRAHDALTDKLSAKFVKTILDDNPTTSRGFGVRFDYSLPDNSYVTGYGHLHAADRDKAGDELHGVGAHGQLIVTKNKDNTATARFESMRYMWRDTIDPNPQYEMDSKFAAILESTEGKSYDIMIVWTDGGNTGQLTWCPTDGNDVRRKQLEESKRGYPFEGGKGAGTKGSSYWHRRRATRGE